MESQTTAPEVQSEQQQPVATENTQATVLTEQPAQQTETKQYNFKDLIPESFKEEKSLQNFNNMEDFVKSYLHAQKMVGANKIPVPNKYATEDDWKEVYDKLGRPETPDGYKYSFKQDEVDPNQLKTFNETAHKIGLLPQQAEALIKYYNDMNVTQNERLEQKADEIQFQVETELKNEYGPKYNKVMEDAKTLANNTLGKDFLNNTILRDGSRLGDNPSIIKMFVGLSEKLSEDQLVQGDTIGYMTASQIEKEIAELTEEGSPYWNKGHPNHKKVVDEVFKLRQQLNA